MKEIMNIIENYRQKHDEALAIGNKLKEYRDSVKRLHVAVGGEERYKEYITPFQEMIKKYQVAHDLDILPAVIKITGKLSDSYQALGFLAAGYEMIEGGR